MTGSSSNNITTQWTFRDGRDYVLSLTNTETPNTICFWISDQVTGEEWTGCYDENCIEVLTKRTGSFKSFSTFLAMVKSAIWKKSESVILELLNIQDLAALSIHRQGTAVNDGGSSSVLPNFDLYSSDDITLTSVGSGPNTKSQKMPSKETNNNGVNGSNKPPSPSPLNKRKYLIVSYIGEFDKVHYPLPLNYASPPDLNVMQNNIMKLKAEVTSLKSAKKELEDHMSAGMPQHSHENNNDANIIHQPHVADFGMGRVEKNQTGQFSTKHVINGNFEEGPDNAGGLTRTVSPTCTQCSRTIEKLLATIQDMEYSIVTQKDEYSHEMEKLENENHFLRHKVNAAEKFEIELWNQIRSLKEQLEQKKTNENEKKAEATKDSENSTIRLSRHDIFYRAKQVRDIKPAAKTPSRTPTKLNNFMPKELCRNRSGNHPPLSQRSRSNSTASYSSAGRCGRGSIEQMRRTSRTQSKEIGRSRSSSSTNNNNLNKFGNVAQKSRIASLSPSKRFFDPTAYVNEKRMKQSKIANLRLQNIESRFRTGSAGSSQYHKSCVPSPFHKSCVPSSCKRLPNLTRTTVSPSTLNKLHKSLSEDVIHPALTKKFDKKCDGKVDSNGNKFNLLRDSLEGKRLGRRVGSRSSSAGGYRIMTDSPISFGETWAEELKNDTETVKKKSLQNKTAFRGDSRNAPNVTTTDLWNRIVKSPAKKLLPNKPKKPNKNSMAINTSLTCDKFESIIGQNSKLGKSSVQRQNDKSRKYITTA